VQTEHVKCVDAAVGGSSQGVADVGVQASRAPGETPKCEGPGPGLKVPGSHASPVKAGAKEVPEAGLPAPARVNVGVQTVAANTADAAVGDFPVELFNSIGELRGAPTKGKRRGEGG